MYSHPPKLLISGVPNANESFGGYILRLTQWNFYRTSSWILKRAGISRDHLHNGYSILFNEEPNFLRLAQLTDVDIAKLQVLAYPPVVSSEPPNRHIVFGKPIHKNFIRLRFSKVCPECLQNANYCRKVWDLAPVTTCPTHKILLLDRCPRCNRRITWARSKVNYCQCGLDWHSVSPTKTADAEVTLTKQIHKLLGLETSEDNLAQFSNSNPLCNLDLEDLLTLVYFIAGQLKGSVLKNGWQLLSLSNAELHSFLTRAVAIFADWPKQYFEFLDWRKGQKNWSKSTTGLVKDFGAFYIAVYRRLKSTEFEFMREQFEEYINRYWKGGSLSPRNRLANTTEFRKKYLTKSQASIQLRCYVTRIDRLIKAGRLKAVVQQQKSRRLFLVDATSVESFKIELEDSLSLSTTAGILGVCRKVVIALVRNESLPLLCGPPIDASHSWRFTRKTVEDLKSAIRSKVVRVKGKSAHKCTFRIAVKKLGYVGLRSEHLIRSILDGKVTPCDMGKTISSLKFVSEDISHYVKEQIRALRGDNTLIREAALRLGFKTMDPVYFLVKKGLISITSKQGNNWSHGLITEAEVINFQSTYILPSAIAVEYGTSAGQITNLLMMNGILPVSGRKVDGGRQYVFKKADLEKVEVTDLVSTARRNRSLRNTKKLFTVPPLQAARMLGVSVKALHRIAENGVLRTYPSRKLETMDNRGFSLFAVNRLRGHSVDYTKLISVSAADKIFGQTHIRFSKSWIQSGCLEIKYRIDKRYLLLDDVQAFVRLRKKTVTPGEAAKILNVGIKAIICHMNTGMTSSPTEVHL